MKQIEKDMMILALIYFAAEANGEKLASYIDKFDPVGFEKLSTTLPFMKSPNAAIDGLKYLANDAYKRVSKKFPSGEDSEP